MANVTLDKIVEEVKTLTLDEQRQLREFLDTLLPPTEEEFERVLLEDGIIGEIPPPITDFTPCQSRKPVEVKDRPVSETIIEERR